MEIHLLIPVAGLLMLILIRSKPGQENKIVTLCQTYLKRKSGLWHAEEDLPKLLFEDAL